MQKRNDENFQDWRTVQHAVLILKAFFFLKLNFVSFSSYTVEEQKHESAHTHTHSRTSVRKEAIQAAIVYLQSREVPDGGLDLASLCSSEHHPKRIRLKNKNKNFPKIPPPHNSLQYSFSFATLPDARSVLKMYTNMRKVKREITRRRNIHKNK